MDIRFSVGELAKLNGITKQMLIFYDRENVFKPKIVNPENGYRYYTADQLEELDSILLLREMGFSLSEIKEYMDSRSSVDTIERLNEQKIAVSEKIKHLTLIERRLNHKIKTIENFNAHIKTDDFIINCDKQYLAVLKTEAPNGLLEVDIALKKLLKYASANEYPHFYQIGDMIDKDALKSETFLKFQYVFLPLDKACEKKYLHIKPAGLYARAFHIGSYKTMGNTYKKLISKIYEQGYSIDGYSYEYCILDNLTTKEPNKYITEIQIKIKKQPQSSSIL